MKAAPFAYQRAGSLADAVRACGNAAAGAKVMGGGQSMGPMLNMRLVRAAILVDVSSAQDMAQVEQRDGKLFIGGALTHSAIEDGALDAALGEASAPLARMLRYVAGTIAYRAIRNRGTLAGSLAHADPAADWVLAMAALDAQLQCVSASGTRQLPATQFMSGAFTTALAEGELLAAVLVPLYSADMRWGVLQILPQDRRVCRSKLRSSAGPAAWHCADRHRRAGRRTGCRWPAWLHR